MERTIFKRCEESPVQFSVVDAPLPHSGDDSVLKGAFISDVSDAGPTRDSEEHLRHRSHEELRVQAAHGSDRGGTVHRLL